MSDKTKKINSIFTQIAKANEMLVRKLLGKGWKFALFIADDKNNAFRATTMKKEDAEKVIENLKNGINEEV